MTFLQSDLMATSSPYLISNVPVRAGETFSIGDSVGIDGAGKAVKLTATTLNTLWNGGVAINANGPFFFEYAVDQIAIVFSTAANFIVIFYNRATDTVTNTYSDTGDGKAGGILLCAKTLPNGEVAMMVQGTSSITAYKFGTSGTLVGAVAVTTVGNYSSNPAIAPSPNAGEFMVIWIVPGTYSCSVQKVLTGMTLGGLFSIAGSGSNGSLGIISTQYSVGTGTMCFVVGNAATNNAYFALMTVSTMAVVGASSSFSVFNGGAFGIIYDSVNVKYRLLFLNVNGPTSFIQYSVTESTGAISAIDYSFAPSQPSPAWSASFQASGWLSSTAILFSGGTDISYVLNYSTAAGGGWTATRVTGIKSFTVAVKVPTFGYDQTSFSISGNASVPSYGTTIAYVYTNADPYSKVSGMTSPYHCYAINPATGAATPLFSFFQTNATDAQSAIALNGTAMLRRAVASKWDCWIRLVPAGAATGFHKLTAVRFPSAVAYGVSKSASTAAITVDLSQMNYAVVDPAVVPLRSRSTVFANGIEYSTGGV